MTKSEVRLIPVPKEVSGTGEKFEIKPLLKCDFTEWKPLLNVAINSLEKIFDLPFEEGDGGISIVYDEGLKNGKYHLKADGKVILSAGDNEGCKYGIATILQLIDIKAGKFCFPEIEIYDYPQKEHRGFMVDLARWWHPKRTIFAYLDLCFYYKIKYIHLHFADCQSYTLPSKAFPKLSTVNRHYSYEDIDEICRYANDRGINIIPEIEMPGHATPLNKEYPEVFSDVVIDGQIKTPSAIICAGRKVCFDALTKLVDEVIKMFPDSKYIHLGGDEAQIDVWEQCEVCQKYMKEHNLNSAKELYSEFTARITDYVISKGRTPIVWEGFPKEAAQLISKDVVVMPWECYYNQPEDLLADGFRIINCAWKPLYICPGTTDWTYKDILNWNTYNMQNFSEKSRATLNPVNLEPSDAVLGAQLCAWEACYEYEVGFVISNLAAFSERMWEHTRICDDESFDKKFDVIEKRAFKLIQER